MGIFKSEKPRAFNHQYIYVDERKERLAKMEENAKRDLGMLPPKELTAEESNNCVNCIEAQHKNYCTH